MNVLLYGKIVLMNSYRTTVSSKGQVVIPAELRQRLSLEKGTPATWSEEDGRLVLTPMTEQRGNENARERNGNAYVRPWEPAAVCARCQRAVRLLRGPPHCRGKNAPTA